MALGDAEVDTGVNPDAGMGSCTVESPEMLGSEMASVSQRVAIASRGNDFALVWREHRATFDDLWVRVYEDTTGGVVATGDLPITTDETGAATGGQSSDPAIVGTASGYVAAWIDSREMGFEMWTRQLGSDGVPSASLQRVTTSAGAASSPALASASNGSLVAGHVHDDTLTGTTREWLVAPIAASGATTGAWTRASAAAELTSLGTLVRDQGTGLFTGWVDGSGNARVRPVTAAGAPTGTAVTHGRADSLALEAAVLLVGRNDGFDALFAQALTPSGAATGVVRSALTADGEGRDPGIAALNGGVVVAYRHTTNAGTQLALALLNSRGERVRTELLGTTTNFGGPVSVAVNSEGYIRIAWAEVDNGVTTTYTQAIVCDDML